MFANKLRCGTKTNCNRPENLAVHSSLITHSILITYFQVVEFLPIQDDDCAIKKLVGIMFEIKVLDICQFAYVLFGYEYNIFRSELQILNILKQK